MGTRSPCRRSRGFTVTEMLIVVAIMGILAAIATPHMGDMIRRQRIKTAAFDVFASLTFARSEAIKRNTMVTLVPVNAANWAFGWRVQDANGTLLRDQAGWAVAPETPTVDILGPVDVKFASSGRATALANISLSSTGVEANSYRCVKLDLSGRAVSKEGACT